MLLLFLIFLNALYLGHSAVQRVYFFKNDPKVEPPTPNRHILKTYNDSNHGWVYEDSFNVFDGPEPGSVPFTYMEADQGYLRGMIVAGEVAKIDSWTQKFVFHALPVEKWCSCKVAISETGDGICGPPLDETDEAERLTGKEARYRGKGVYVLDEKEHSPDLPDCTETNPSPKQPTNLTCTCSHPNSAWRSFGKGKSQNTKGCRFPTPRINRGAFKSFDKLALSDPTENTLLCGQSWSQIVDIDINSVSDDKNKVSLKYYYVNAVLNILNGACDCSKYADVCTPLFDAVEAVKSYFDGNCDSEISSDDWDTIFSGYFNTFRNFNHGITGPGVCGENGYDDAHHGGGCCTKCPRVGTENDVKKPENYYRIYDASPQKDTLASDPHRMLISLYNYAGLGANDGWCPRMSFYAPCPEWNSNYD